MRLSNRHSIMHRRRGLQFSQSDSCRCGRRGPAIRPWKPACTSQLVAALLLLLLSNVIIMLPISRSFLSYAFARLGSCAMQPNANAVTHVLIAPPAASVAILWRARHDLRNRRQAPVTRVFLRPVRWSNTAFPDQQCDAFLFFAPSVPSPPRHNRKDASRVGRSVGSRENRLSRL